MSTSVIQPLSPDLALPWTPNAKQEELFKRWTQRTFIFVLLLYIVVPWLPVFEPEYVAPEKKVVRTKVVLEALKPPPVKPVVVTPKPKPVAKEKPKPVKPKKSKTIAKKSTTPKAKPKTTKASLSQSKGLASLSSQLTALRGSLNVAGMKKKRTSTNAKGMVATVDRDILGENRATQASLGVSVDENLMKSASTQLAGHTTSSVEDSVSGGSANGTQTNSSYVSGQRDEESIRRVFEQKKGLIYSLYYDALNEYPDLHGKFVFKLVIKPDGDITQLALVSSELGLSELESSILNRIKGINFGVADVSPTKIEYRFVFIPS